MSKIVVDFGLCESNGVCMGIIPEVFDLDDQDYLHVLTDEVTPDNEERVRESAHPARAARSKSVCMRATSSSGCLRTSSTTSGTEAHPTSWSRATFILSWTSAAAVACHCILSYSATTPNSGQAKSTRHSLPCRSTIGRCCACPRR